jgi:hypothetical protein
MRVILLILVVISTTVLRSSGNPQETPAKPVATWPASGYTRVVAYRFKFPPTEYFSLIEKSSVNMEQLKKLAVKSAVLNEAQTKKLLDATFSPKRMTSAACYEPHHIFVFYDKNDKVTHAIEVCFDCTSVHATPDLTKSQQYRHDFRALALLCDELGVWLLGNTTKQYFQIWDERDKDP